MADVDITFKFLGDIWFAVFLVLVILYCIASFVTKDRQLAYQAHSVGVAMLGFGAILIVAKLVITKASLAELIAQIIFSSVLFLINLYILYEESHR